MKRTLLILVILTLTLTALAGCAAPEAPAALPVEAPEGFGAEGASADDAYTLEEMLTYAIEDEYLARAEYELILSQFDVTRPFENIMKAEETHIALLEPLFETYGFDVPADLSGDHLIIPDDLETVFAIGVDAEIANIAMYEAFLEEDLPDEVRIAFESLMRASESHLVAFQRNLDRYR